MNKILEIETESMCAVVQPGVVNADLQKEVARYGLMYPPDPASMFVSTMGGNVALNAGGPRGVKYGVTRDYLLGMEVVLPSGEVIRTGGKTLKNVTGYDLTRLMCGSEGTLGIITEITVRLVPLAPAKATLQAIFSDLDDAATTVSAIIGSGIVPTTLELIDRVVLDVIRDYGGAQFYKGQHPRGCGETMAGEKIRLWCCCASETQLHCRGRHRTCEETSRDHKKDS